MNFQNAVKTCLSKYATFHGRASRPEYWWFFLFVILVTLLGEVLDRALFPVHMVPVEGTDMMRPDRWLQPFGTIASLALILPALAVGARRLHDMGKSAWWLLLCLLPIIGSLVLLYFLVQPSKNDGNPFA